MRDPDHTADDGIEPTRREVLAAAGAAGAASLAGCGAGLGGGDAPESESVAPERARTLAEAHAPDLYFGVGERWFPTDPREYLDGDADGRQARQRGRTGRRRRRRRQPPAGAAPADGGADGRARTKPRPPAGTAPGARGAQTAAGGNAGRSGAGCRRLTRRDRGEAGSAPASPAQFDERSGSSVGCGRLLPSSGSTRRYFANRSATRVYASTTFSRCPKPWGSPS